MGECTLKGHTPDCDKRHPAFALGASVASAAGGMQKRNADAKIATEKARLRAKALAEPGQDNRLLRDHAKPTVGQLRPVSVMVDGKAQRQWTRVEIRKDHAYNAAPTAYRVGGREARTVFIDTYGRKRVIYKPERKRSMIREIEL